MTPKTLVIGALLVAALVGGLTLTAPFVYEDANWRGSLASRHGATWRLPGRELTMQTYRLTPDPISAHALNVVIHLANGALVYALGSVLVGPVAGSIGALIFLLHPLTSETVAYVTARSDLLLTGFLLLTTLWAVRAIERGGWYLPLTALAAIAAAMTKEIGIVAVPFAALTVLVWTPDSPQRRFVMTGAYLLCGLLVGLGLPMAQRAGGMFMGLQLAALWRLLALAIWPVGFSIDHDTLALAPLVPLAVGVTVVSLALAWWSRGRGRVLLWMAGSIAIVVGPRILIASPEFLSEHWLYPAMPALALAGGVGLAWLTRGATGTAPLQEV